MDNQNLKDLSGSTTIWVGNNPYLVNSSGVIPLTSGFSALSLAQQTQPQTSNQGQYYVVSVQESPTKPSPGLGNPRTGLGVYDSSALTASTPNLGNLGNNNFQQTQFTPQPFNFQYNPVLTNQFPPTFTNGYLTLPNTQKPLTINPTLVNGNSTGYGSQNGGESRRYSQNGNSYQIPQVSPSLSSSSTSMLSESSFNAFPSPDQNISCIYSSDPFSPKESASPISGPPTLPKPKRPSLNGSKDENDNEAPKKIYQPVPPRYDRPVNKEYCLRCEKKVYHMEKLGPVKDCLYHKLCFSCVVCNTTLNVKNYHVNPNDMEDLNVYCVTHVPSNKPVSVDANSVGIKTALNVQRKTSEGNGSAKYKGHTYNLEVESLSYKHAKNVPAPNLQTSNKLRETSWTRNGRAAEGVPPPDVVRYNEPVPEFDHMTTRFYNSP